MMRVACTYCRRTSDQAGNCEGCGAPLPLPDYMRVKPQVGDSYPSTFTYFCTSLAGAYPYDPYDMGRHNRNLLR